MTKIIWVEPDIYTPPMCQNKELETILRKVKK